MKVNLLVIQRKGSYRGEYAPEVLVVQDEFSADENPDWFSEQVKEQLDGIGDEIDAHAILTVRLNDKQIQKALYPSAEMTGEIVGESL